MVIDARYTANFDTTSGYWFVNDTATSKPVTAPIYTNGLDALNYAGLLNHRNADIED